MLPIVVPKKITSTTTPARSLVLRSKRSRLISHTKIYLPEKIKAYQPYKPTKLFSSQINPFYHHHHHHHRITTTTSTYIMVKKHLRPVFDDAEDELEAMLRKHEEENMDYESEDEFATLSFGALKNAQDKLDQQEDTETKPKAKDLKNVREQIKQQIKEQYRPKPKPQPESDDENEEEQGGFFEGEPDEDSNSDQEDQPTIQKKSKKKHAPSERSSKKKPPRVRSIPGLDTKKSSTIFQDIRFNTALGKADADQIRRDYKFLDDYRKKEVEDIEKILKDKKHVAKLSQDEIDELQYQAKSLKSRLQSLQAKDQAKAVLAQYHKEHASANGNKFYLKKSEERKIIQKHRFENMKKNQVEKSMERKRKRRLGKEFRALEFNKPRN